MCLLIMSNIDAARSAIDFDRPAIVPILNDLDAWSGPHGQKSQQLGPVEGRPVGESDEELIRLCAALGRSPQLAGRSSEGCAHSVIELAKALEPGREGNLGNRQRRVANERTREVNASRGGDLDGRGAQMCREKPPQMPIAKTQSACELSDR
jgi:hypothetical protein